MASLRSRLVLGWLVQGALLAACGGGSERRPVAPEAKSDVASDAVASEQPSEEAVPDVVARATFVPLVSSIRPGKPFWLALRFDIHPGYTLSWRYPGDVGRETSVRFEAPAGFDVGPVRFPPPERRELSEGRVTYGYQQLAAVFVEVRPPSRLSTSEAYRFDVKSDFMACKRECVSENMSAFFELTASFTGGKAEMDDELEALQASLPRPLADFGRARHRWQGSQLVITADGATFVDFFPSTESTHRSIRAAVLDDGSAIALSLSDRGAAAPEAVQGVLAVEMSGKASYFDVDLPYGGHGSR